MLISVENGTEGIDLALHNLLRNLLSEKLLYNGIRERLPPSGYKNCAEDQTKYSSIIFSHPDINFQCRLIKLE
jgi:hypothetical protein